MNTENMIDVTDIDLKKLAKAAYSLSKPQGFGFIHYEEGTLSDNKAEELITDSKTVVLRMDYVKGRACKLTVFQKEDKRYINKLWYDHTEKDLTDLLEMARQ